MENNLLSAEEGFVTVHGLRIAYQLFGDPNATPVLALHGWLDNSATFNRIIPLIPNARICAVDLAGHGFSDHRPSGTRYHMVDNLYEIDGLLDHLGWQSCILLGHSMGAGFAAFYAAVFPQKVEKLIMLEGIAPPSSPAAEAAEKTRKSILEFKRLEKKKKAIYAEYADAVYARMYGALHVSKSASEILCQRGLMQTEGGWTWRSDPRLITTSTMRFTEELVQGYLSQIKCPILLLIAAEGLIKKFPALRERINVLSNCQTHELPGGHHFHLEDQAELVANAINLFLSA